MTNTCHEIKGGLYLVIDPAEPLEVLLPKLEQALQEGVQVLQVWNHFSAGTNALAYTRKVMAVAANYGVPVLINENRVLFLESRAAGIHFDVIPPDLEILRRQVKAPFLTGITCGNNVQHLQWAASNGIDYVSFCSMYPSASAGACEIVNPASVIHAGKIFKGPIFLSGGITLQNIQNLAPLGAQGVAVIAGILQAENVAAATAQYSAQLQKIVRKKEPPPFS